MMGARWSRSSVRYFHEWIEADEHQLRQRRGRHAARITDRLHGVYLTHLNRDHNVKMDVSEPLRYLRDRHHEEHDRCDHMEENDG